MAQDQTQGSHPADGLIEAIKGLFNGDNVRQSLRDTYDRITGQQPSPTPAPAAAQPQDTPEDKAWRSEVAKSFEQSNALPAPSKPPARTAPAARALYGSLSKRRPAPVVSPQK